MASFYLNGLCKDHLQTQSFWGLGLQHRNLGGYGSCYSALLCSQLFGCPSWKTEFWGSLSIAPSVERVRQACLCSLAAMSPAVVSHRGPSARMKDVGAEPSLCLPTAWPARFQEGLKDLEVLEGGAATLRCTLSSVVTPVEWHRGDEVLQPGGKYSLRQEGTVLELVVRDLRPQDSGQYSCCFGDQMTLATLTVKGKRPCLPCPQAPFIPVGG